jgi:tagatose-6-phosphate ketose/aldose isomerase
MMLAASLVFSGSESINVAQLAQATRELLAEHNAGLRMLATANYSRVVYLGSNGFKALAREAALKLLELTDGKVVAAFDSPLGFRHGPKTIVTADTLVFVFVSNDPYTRRYDLDLVRELRCDGVAARIVAITAQADDLTAEAECLRVAHVATAADHELCLPYIVCGQLYAFHRALALGNTPDQPSQSGTVTRVVHGVTIHAL